VSGDSGVCWFVSIELEKKYGFPEKFLWTFLFLHEAKGLASPLLCSIILS